MTTTTSTTIVATVLLNSNILANYLGSTIFILGMIGESLNISVFLSLRTFRQNSCAFYLTLASGCKIIQLLTGLLTRIIASATGIDWTAVSPAFCKIRSYFLEFCPISTLSLLCLAVIDQYFATSSRVRWQQWCHIKIAYRLSAIFIIICLLVSIPHSIFFAHVISPMTNSSVCIITNKMFECYNNVFNIPVLYGPLPLLITIIFSVLTYRHVRQIGYRTVPLVRRRLDQQLTTMVLTQIMFNFLVIIPNVIMIVVVNFTNIHRIVATSSETQFIITTISFIYYSYSAVNIHFYKNQCLSFNFRFCFVFFRVHSIFIFVHRNDFVINYVMFYLIFI